MYFVFISEQTATSAAYNQDEKCLLRGTCWVFN